MPSTVPGTDDTEMDKRKWRHLLMCETVGMRFDSICVLNPTLTVFCTACISVKLSTDSSVFIDFHPSLHFCHFFWAALSSPWRNHPLLPPPRPLSPFGKYSSARDEILIFAWLESVIWLSFWQAIFPGYKFQSGRISRSPNIKDVILLCFSFYCFFWGVFCLIFSPMKVMCLSIWQLFRFPFVLKVQWSHYDASGCCFPCIGPTCV